MSAPVLPSTMRAQQYKSSAGGLEKNIALNPSAPLPKRKPNQHLVQTIAASLNPVDYKIAEIPLITRFIFTKPICPVRDFAGRIIEPADGSPLKPGQLVFGSAGRGAKDLNGGALAEYAIAVPDAVTALPEGLDPVWGASVAIAGLTAYQSIVPFVKEGSNIFINGGSGGTGIFGIQIAKAKGCYVTTTCSTPNVELCKGLGADEVIDYKKGSVLEALAASGRKYDHIVDNVGAPDLYFKAHTYTTSNAKFMAIGGKVSLGYLRTSIAMRTLPGFLGGGKRKILGFFADPNRPKELEQIGAWMKEGKIKAVIDSTFKLEDTPKAFERLKTGRARGKVIVEVASA